MPKSAQYKVRLPPEGSGYLLTGPENEASRSLSEEDWLDWLEEHRAFAFHGRNGQINLLKEKRERGGEGYWYAYRRHAGRMVKRYVGRSAQVSMERLEEVSALLAYEDQAERASVPLAQTRQTSIAANSVPFEPLLVPKLQLPRAQRSLLLREHLLEMLDKGLERKLTLIAGPAGYGKTTLVGQWLVERGAQADFPRVASFTLDEGDNDPIRFWRYIIAACQGFRAEVGAEALALLSAHRLPPFKPLDLMLTALLNELSQLERPAVLILDDFHVINSSQVAEMLSFFLEHLPTSLHLIILIRGDPPFSIARLRARNEILDIYPPDLAFSLEETRAFLSQELSFAFSPQILRQIYERVEGWPTGLRLLVRALSWTSREQGIEHVLATFAGSRWNVQDYFFSEVLYRLPTQQQEFLLQTSILPRITAALCDAITGRKDAVRLIEALRGGDLFLIPLDVTGEWMRYHSLFAESMQQEARRRLGDERLSQLAAQASRWYEEHGLLAEAIETALDAADSLHAADLIELFIESRQQGNIYAISEVYSLRRWLERLPEEELSRRPDLCLHYAMNLLFITMEGPRLLIGRERIYHLLQVAEQQWRDTNNTAKLAEVFAFRALLDRQEGKLLSAVTWARQALTWLLPEDRTWRNLSLTVVGIGEMLDGTLDAARNALLEALGLSEQQGNTIYARATRGMLSGVSIEQGELRHACEQLRQIQAEARVQEDRDDIAHTQLGLAQILYQWNDLQAAEQAAHEALEIGDAMWVEEFQFRATLRLALIEHVRGQSMQAQQRLISWLVRAQVPTSPFSYQLTREVQATLARIQLASGDMASVERWFASSERSGETLPLLQQRREQVLQARLLLAQGEIAAAIEKLEDLYASAVQTGHHFFMLEVQVVLALAYARQGAHPKAREQLRDVLVATHAEGYLRLFLDEGEELFDLLRGLLSYLRENMLLAYARHILNAFTRHGTAIQKATPEAPFLEPLSQQERKVLRLLAAGNSNAAIASELVVSVNTVRTQVQSIYRKLNVSNRVEASAVARQLDLK
ncbi:MAG: LuxR C-terminal-related transcriptional regulator [Chloroflexota bacterium]|nr:LuxR C-terminal-related transcriptional regulator [Chloroflexota bacterium]